MVVFRKKRKNGSKRRKARSRKTVRRARRVNPRRKRSRAKRKRGYMGTVHRPRLRKVSGKWYASSSKRALIKRGTRINPKRKRSRRRVRRNPIGITKMFNRNILITTAKAGAGIAIGFAAMPLFYKILPQALKDQRRYLGGVHVALGLAIAGMSKNKNIKDVAMVIAATGMYDLIAMNLDFLGLPPLRTTSPLVDKMIPSATAPAAAVEGCYGGTLKMTHMGASYPTMGAPASAVAARGIGSSFERMGASYPSLAYPSIGLSGEGGSDLELDGMIN